MSRSGLLASSVRRIVRSFPGLRPVEIVESLGFNPGGYSPVDFNARRARMAVDNALAMDVKRGVMRREGGRYWWHPVTVIGEREA